MAKKNKWTAKYTIAEFLDGKKVREYEVSEEYMRRFLAGQVIQPTERGEMKIDCTYIRAKINGKWGSFSISELADISTPESWDQINQWYYEKAYETLGVVEGAEVKKDDLEKYLEALIKLGAKIVMVKKEL